MKTERLILRVAAGEKATFLAAAKRAGLSLSAWVRMVLKREAEDEGS